MCLQRWGFCNLAVLGSEGVNHSWKRYYLRRSHLEMKMTKGRSGGYTCKSLRGHTGMLSLSLSGVSFAWLHNVSDLILTPDMLSIRQGGGVGVPAGEFSSASRSLQRCHSVQRLYWWYSPSMEHPKRQCRYLQHIVLLNVISTSA